MDDAEGHAAGSKFWGLELTRVQRHATESNPS
jgi:hypothetical protein